MIVFEVWHSHKDDDDDHGDEDDEGDWAGIYMTCICPPNDPVG